MQTNSHLSRLIHDQAEKYGDREVLVGRSGNPIPGISSRIW